MLKKFLHQANIISCILQVSPDGIANRDEKVFRFARERNIPIVMLTSGPPLSLSLCVRWGKSGSFHFTPTCHFNRPYMLFWLGEQVSDFSIISFIMKHLKFLSTESLSELLVVIAPVFHLFRYINLKANWLGEYYPETCLKGIIDVPRWSIFLPWAFRTCHRREIFFDVSIKYILPRTVDDRKGWGVCSNGTMKLGPVFLLPRW